MWLRVTHRSKGPILLNSNHVLYIREMSDGHEGHNCEVYFSFTDFIVVNEPRAEMERQIGGRPEIRAAGVRAPTGG